MKLTMTKRSLVSYILGGYVKQRFANVIRFVEQCSRVVHSIDFEHKFAVVFELHSKQILAARKYMLAA